MNLLLTSEQAANILEQANNVAAMHKMMQHIVNNNPLTEREAVNIALYHTALTLQQQVNTLVNIITNTL